MPLPNYDENAAILQPLRLAAEQTRRAAVTVCARAADLDDARELLAALGLLGENQDWLSPGELGRMGARVVHGTRSAVEFHRAAGHDRMCKPCLRWVEVNEHPDTRLDRGDDERCGTHAGWRAHYKREEPPCDACIAARKAYARERRAHPEEHRRPTARCGTRSGYERHRALHQRPCEACREANRAAGRARAARLAGPQAGAQ